MAFQPSVAQYFGSRKRQAVDEVKETHQNKVLLLESSSQDIANIKVSDESQKHSDTANPSRIVYVEEHKVSLAKLKDRNSCKKKVTQFKSAAKGSREQKANGIQMDIRKIFLNGTNKIDANDVAKESEPSDEREVTIIVYMYKCLF